MDSVNKQGSLLKVVQVLSDLNLVVRRAYITSDGEWFMDGNAPKISCNEELFDNSFTMLINLIVYYSCDICSW